MKRKVRTNLEEKLAEEHVCYVLITCDKPTLDGSMQVEMSFGGEDPVLASYLLQGAKNVVDENVEEEICESRSQMRLIK